MAVERTFAAEIHHLRGPPTPNTLPTSLFPRPSSQSDEASARVRALLFSRLTPLLLLNALPPGALVAEDGQQQQHQREQQQQLQQSTRTECREEGAGSAEAVGGCLEDIRGLLLERTERVYEYDQVNGGDERSICWVSMRTVFQGWKLGRYEVGPAWRLLECMRVNFSKWVYMFKARKVLSFGG